MKKVVDMARPNLEEFILRRAPGILLDGKNQGQTCEAVKDVRTKNHKSTTRMPGSEDFGRLSSVKWP